jgi:hypothetical protein
VKDNRPDNVPRLTAKFRKDIQYVRKAFPIPEYHKHVFMLWSPVVKNQRTGSKYNQAEDVQQIIETCKREFGVLIEPVINERFQEMLRQLRRMAKQETKELDSSVMRFLQVEEHLDMHLKRSGKGDKNRSGR